MMDLSPFIKVRVSGPGALGYLQRLAAGQMDRPPGKVTYTVLLNEQAGIVADLTITRLADDEFLVVDGAGTGLRTISRIRDLAPTDGSVRVEDVSSAWCCLGVWGPNAQAVLDAIAERPLDVGRFGSQAVTIGGVPALALRVSYVGEHGWELYAPTEYGLRLWDALWEAGRPHGMAPAGLAAQDSLRLEKGYRLWGQDIHTEFDPFEAGLDFTVAFDKGDFIGRDALLQKRDAGPARRLSCLVLDERERVLVGKEPILVGSEKVGYVTSANFGFAVDRSIAYGYLPTALATPGRARRPRLLRRALPGDRHGRAALRPIGQPASRAHPNLKHRSGPRAGFRAPTIRPTAHQGDQMTQPEPEFTVISADRLIDGLGGPPIETGGVPRQQRPDRPGRAPRGPQGARRRVSRGTSLPGRQPPAGLRRCPHPRHRTGRRHAGRGRRRDRRRHPAAQAAANVRRMLNMGVTTARENGAKNRTGFSIRGGHPARHRARAADGDLRPARGHDRRPSPFLRPGGRRRRRRPARSPGPDPRRRRLDQDHRDRRQHQELRPAAAVLHGPRAADDRRGGAQPRQAHGRPHHRGEGRRERPRRRAST